MDKFKVCKVCEEKKAVHEFPKHQFPRMGHRDKCKACCGIQVHKKRDSGTQWAIDTFRKLNISGMEY